MYSKSCTNTSKKDHKSSIFPKIKYSSSIIQPQTDQPSKYKQSDRYVNNRNFFVKSKTQQNDESYQYKNSQYISEDSDDNTEIDQLQQKDKSVKELDNIKVQCYKIDDYQNNLRLEEDAKNFVKKLKVQKQRFKGRLHLLKIKELHKRKQEQRSIRELQQKEKLNLMMNRKHKALKNIQNLKKKAAERKKYINLHSQKSHHKSNATNSLSIDDKRLISHSNRNQLGNKYLDQLKMMKGDKCSFSMTTDRRDYSLLLQDERKEIQQLHKKINKLRNILK